MSPEIEHILERGRQAYVAALDELAADHDDALRIGFLEVIDQTYELLMNRPVWEPPAAHIR